MHVLPVPPWSADMMALMTWTLAVAQQSVSMRDRVSDDPDEITKRLQSKVNEALGVEGDGTWGEPAESADQGSPTYGPDAYRVLTGKVGQFTLFEDVDVSQVSAGDHMAKIMETINRFLRSLGDRTHAQVQVVPLVRRLDNQGLIPWRSQRACNLNFSRPSAPAAAPTTGYHHFEPDPEPEPEDTAAADLPDVDDGAPIQYGRPTTLAAVRSARDHYGNHDPLLGMRDGYMAMLDRMLAQADAQLRFATERADRSERTLQATQSQLDSVLRNLMNERATAQRAIAVKDAEIEKLRVEHRGEVERIRSEHRAEQSKWETEARIAEMAAKVAAAEEKANRRRITPKGNGTEGGEDDLVETLLGAFVDKLGGGGGSGGGGGDDSSPIPKPSRMAMGFRIMPRDKRREFLERVARQDVKAAMRMVNDLQGIIGELQGDDAAPEGGAE